MRWHKLIFSDKKPDKVKRHLLFWLLWWVYFAATYYYYVQVGLKAIAFGEVSVVILFKTFLLLLIHVAACYAFIYLLLPRFLLKKKYLLLSAYTSLLAVALLIVGYLVHVFIFPLIDASTNYDATIDTRMIWWASINSVLLNAPKIIAAATAIKLTKRWYLKQKEKERIEREKLVTELQLLKAQIRPDFLIGALNQIYLHTLKKSTYAPELLIRFSDLLSYMLYECDDFKVPLGRELFMTKEFIGLEKFRFNGSLDMELAVKGDVAGKYIAPLLLLPFIDNCFRQGASSEEQSWINMDIKINEDLLTVKLTNGIAPGYLYTDTVRSGDVKIVQQRLELLYRNNYELKMYADNEIFITVLKLNLSMISDPENNSLSTFAKPGVLPNYAAC